MPALIGLAVAGTLALFGIPPSAPASASDGLAGRVIVGYQGWFGCPGDYLDNRRWQHWVIQPEDTQAPTPDNIRVDLLPQLAGVPEQDLCPSGLKSADGAPIALFSSQNAQVVLTHFRWMAQHQIDGVAVQRFIGIIDDRPDNPQGRARSDHMLGNVRAAAAATERVFFITYDISGAPPATLFADIRRDWQHLTGDLDLTASPNYLRMHGKPVLQLWGFGFADRPGAPPEVAELIADLKQGRHGLKAAALIGGVPTNWRTLNGDSQQDPRWADIYRSYDVISPWSVGRFHDESGADAFLKEHVLGDLAETRRLGIAYLPVIFPGFSWFNLQTRRGQAQRAVLNEIPRRCGRLLWREIANVLGSGANMLYGAMFDEVDEGTAMLPAVTRADRLPVGVKMVFLNEDDCSLPADWYLRVIGAAAGFAHRAEAPPRELDAVLKP